MIQWQDLHHSELTVQSLYALLRLRCEVFVVEQTCPYQDIDGDDLTGENRHILGWKDNELVAYARILKSEDDFEPVVIGRVIVSNKARGEKLGYQLMEKTLDADLQPFYGHFGFTPVTDVYDEDGIPHIGMAREVKQA